MEENKPKGTLAFLFSPDELKSFFQNYLLVLCLLEGFLFFGCFISYLSAQGQEFPWKFYLFSAFSAPIALTLVFGLTLKVFDAHFFSASVGQDGQGQELRSRSRADLLLGLGRQVPVLLWFVILLLATGLLYKLDDIAAFVVATGEAAARYLLILIGSLMGGLTLLCVLWIAFNYLLKKRRMDQNHQFRMEVLQRTGVVLIDSGRMNLAEGQAAAEGMISHQEGEDDNLPLVPRLRR